jgi:formate--tetrahydrofolate ligase
VATVRALKYNGGVDKSELTTPDVDALKRGIINLRTHIENMFKYHVPVVVAINRFHTDSEEELAFIAEYCKKLGVETSMCEVFAKGGEGGVDLAEKVCETIEMCEDNEDGFRPLYKNSLSIARKVETVAREIYRADGVKFLPKAAKALQEIEDLGYAGLPVCIAKTQYSLSDDPRQLGKPENFTITVRDVRLSAGAGFVVVLTGDIMTMPGLPKAPAAFKIDCDNEGNISGLF